MKLASYRAMGSDAIRLGSECGLPESPALIDLERAWHFYVEQTSDAMLSGDRQKNPMSWDAIGFIEGGAEQLARARRALEHCRQRAADESGRQTLLERGILQSEADVQFLPPVPRPGKFISLGVNYPTHLAEASDLPVVQRLKSGPGVPRAFAKLPSVLIGHRQPIIYPAATKQLDYEIELALVIGKRCKNVPLDKVSDVIYGYTIFNDISMRDVQRDEMATGLLLLGKNFDTAGPIGPWLVTKDEIPDPNALDMTLTVNDEVRQHDNTRNMIHPVPKIVAFWSQITLEPGDIISTGTPAGVGIFCKPPEKFLLHSGDRVAATITGLGTLENTVIADEA